MSSNSSPDEFPKVLQQLIKSVEKEEEMNPHKAKQLIEKVNLETQHLIPWVDFNHPKSDSYGRKLIYKGDFYELMVMSWVPGDFSAIHDHGTAEWGAVQVFGSAEHAIFGIKKNELRTLDRTTMNNKQIIPVSHELIHQMGNNTQSNYLSLHLYGSYQADENVTGDARLFELNLKEIQFTDGGVFFVLPEEFINYKRPSPSSDYLTTLRHNVESLRRLEQMKPYSSRQTELMKREKEIREEIFDSMQREEFERNLDPKMIDEPDKIINILNWNKSKDP